MDIISYILSKKYTDTSLLGGGAIKGKNCTITSIESITGGNRITFRWTLDDGTVQTETLDVMDGETGATGATGPAGVGIASMTVDPTNHLIVTYTDGTSEDVGEVPGDIQADWLRESNQYPDYIKNKPAIKSGTGQNSIIITGGSTTVASGNNFIAIGSSARAIGDSSFAINSGKAYALATHVEGSSEAGDPNADPSGKTGTSDGRYSHAEGVVTHTYGNASHSEGYNTTTYGFATHAEGYGSQAGNDEYDHGAHAEGNGTLASAPASHAEGNGTTASGTNAHAEGSSTTAQGQNSHAEGSSTYANGVSSHAEGNGGTASGYASHVEGNGCSATADDSHAEGAWTTASGVVSHAGGDAARATGYGAFAHGNQVVAANNNDVAFGIANDDRSAQSYPDSYTIFSVGNGTINGSTVVRQNAFEVRSNGDIYAGSSKLNGLINDTTSSANTTYSSAKIDELIASIPSGGSGVSYNYVNTSTTVTKEEG